uniref:C2H2-type domain-containing protein n=1 Tax=Clastoptera arizonana TaxID=38151 RepID=A0A1B6DZ53_9HEMI
MLFSKIFVCSLCDIKFYSKQNLRRHRINVHKVTIIKNKSQGKFKCNVCNAGFSCKGNLNRHIREQHVSTSDEAVKITCPACNKCFRRTENLIYHINSRHDGQSGVCPKCNETFPDVHVLCKHECQGEFNYIDKSQDKSQNDVSQGEFNYNDKSQDKLQNIGSKGKFICNVCNASLSSKKSLERHCREQHVSMNDAAVRISCPVCDKSFRRFENLINHLKCRHYGQSGVCSTCNETFPSIHLLYKHNQDKHSSKVQKKESEANFHCNQCNNSYTKKFNLNKHMDKVHNINLIKRPPSKVCPLCDAVFQTIPILEKHLVENHNIQLKEEYLYFDSFEEFNNWKKDIEKEDLAFFPMKNSINNRTYYACHRSGISKGTDKCLRLKSTPPSVKTGKNCTARIIARSEEGYIKVYCQRTHVGHAQSIKYLRLTKEERDELAEKYKRGMTIDSILDDIRESASIENMGRKHLVNKRDLYNIVRDYKLGKDVQKIDEDEDSVNMWEEEQNSLGENSPSSFEEIETTEILDESQDAPVYIDNSASLLTRIETLLNSAQSITKTLNEEVLPEAVHRIEDFVEFLRQNQTDPESASSIPTSPRTINKLADS